MKKMQINNITEFKSFINDLSLVNRSYANQYLNDIYTDRDRDLYILDLEKRKVIQTSQTFSLDSDWVSHIEETTLFELYIETLSRNKKDTTVLTFKTLDDLKKVEQFIKDNFKFLKKQ